MDMMSILLIIVLIAIVALLVAVLMLRTDIKKANQSPELKSEMRESREETIRTVQNSFTGLRTEIDKKFNEQSMQNEQKLDNIRNTMEKRISALQEDNSRQLDRMRGTVDEKLQETLDKRISESFKLVNDRLEQVYKGLGEMQNLATGVGDLKKVLSNVKTRGTLGEIQLEAILDEILSQEQYDKQVKIEGCSGPVDFVVNLPGDDERVLLPIDAKFPADYYSKLIDAYEIGDQELVRVAGKELDRAIKQSAKDIKDKYINPPFTTDFAIMFLPVEGLYAEVVRRGLVEVLQRDYKINIAGPTTMAALLNSLQMGFKTLAIQKRSSEVWNVLGAVKTEFNRFEGVLSNAQKKINQANNDLEDLIGTRTRMMQSKLKKVSELPDSESKKIIEVEDNFEG